MYYVTLLLFLFGLCIGSFLNVVIYRLPKGESIAFPASHCPSCKNKIKRFDLIPVVSWLILRGQCRSCGIKISWRYSAVELFCGLVFVWAYFEFSYSPALFLMLTLASVLIAISFIDFEHGIIPFSILCIGAIPAVIGAIFSVNVSILDAIAGAALGGGIILLINQLSSLLYKRDGMGGGDLALMLMSGLFLGARNTVLSLFLGIVFGGIYAISVLASRKAKRNETFPFGPFLSVGIWISALYGHSIIAWYLSLFPA